MVLLNDDLFINEGTNRACYKDPTEISKCLKIDIRKNKETKSEIKYYRRLEKNDISFEMLSKYYGKKDTNYGEAESFELIKDFDGSISKEMDKYLDDTNNSLEDIETLLKYIPLLKEYIFKNKIYVKDLNTVNIMYQIKENNKRRLVIIDGIAHSNYNPLFYICKFFILKKITISWNKFITSVKNKNIIQKNPHFLRYIH